VDFAAADADFAVALGPLGVGRLVQQLARRHCLRGVLHPHVAVEEPQLAVAQVVVLDVGGGEGFHG
nr:hypothetical protein [Tanacetum cinerariifolium]